MHDAIARLKQEFQQLKNTPLPITSDYAKWNTLYEQKQEEIQKLRLAIVELEHPKELIERRILARIESNKLLNTLPDLYILLDFKLPSPPPDFEGRLVKWQMNQ